MAPGAQTIAGTDSGCRVGAQAAPKICSALEVYRASVGTALVTRNMQRTGRPLSAAIALEAVADGLGVGWGAGHGPVHHFRRVWGDV